MIIQKKGTAFSQKTFDFMRSINNKSDWKVLGLSRKRNEAYSSVERIAKSFCVLPTNITIAMGDNWYVLFCDGQEYITVIDVVVPCVGNTEKPEKEVTKYLSDNIIKKAIKEKKHVSFSAYVESAFYEIIGSAFYGNEQFQKDARLSTLARSESQMAVVTYSFVGKNKKLLKENSKQGNNSKSTVEDELPF